MWGKKVGGMNKRVLLCAISITVTGCDSSEKTDAVPETSSESLTGISEIEAATSVAKLSDPDLKRVCKAGAAFRNGRSVDGIDSEVTAEQQVRLSYTRDDGKFFRYDCLVEGDTLRFRMIDEAGPGTGPGNWSGNGSRTTFKLNSDSVELTDDFFDGSSDTDTIKI